MMRSCHRREKPSRTRKRQVFLSLLPSTRLTVRLQIQTRLKSNWHKKTSSLKIGAVMFSVKRFLQNQVWISKSSWIRLFWKRICLIWKRTRIKMQAVPSLKRRWIKDVGICVRHWFNREPWKWAIMCSPDNIVVRWKQCSMSAATVSKWRVHPLQ